MPKLRLRDATILVASAPGANLGPVEIHVGDGNITWSEKRTVNYVLDRGLLFDAAGNSVGVARYGDDQPVDVNVDLFFDSYTVVDGSGGTGMTPIQVITGVDEASFDSPASVRTPYHTSDDLFDALDLLVGDATALVDALALYDSSRNYDYTDNDSEFTLWDDCAPYCCDIALSFAKDCGGVDSANIYLFKYFRWESMNYDLGAGRISCSGKCQEIYAYGIDSSGGVGASMQPTDGHSGTNTTWTSS